MHVLAEWFFFFGEHRGFLKEVVKIYLMTSMLPFNSPTFFPIVASIVYAYYPYHAI